MKQLVTGAGAFYMELWPYLIEQLKKRITPGASAITIIRCELTPMSHFKGPVLWKLNKMEHLTHFSLRVYIHLQILYK